MLDPASTRRAGNPIPTVCDLMAGRGLHSTHLAEMRAIETATAIKNPRGRVFRGTIGVKALHSKKFVTDVWNSSFSISPFATKAGMNAVSRNCLSGLARVREPARRAFRRHGNRGYYRDGPQPKGQLVPRDRSEKILLSHGTNGPTPMHIVMEKPSSTRFGGAGF